MTKTTKTSRKRVHEKIKTALAEHPPHGYFVIVALCTVLALAVGVVNWQFHDKTLPNVYVGSVPVGQLTRSEVAGVVRQEIAQLKVVFQQGNAQTSVPAKDLGMVIDVNETVKNVMLTRRSANIAQNLAVWQAQKVPLVYINDAGVLKEYIVRHFPSVYVDPQDAQLVFNNDTKQFDIKPGVPGKGFDIKRFESALPDLAASPRAVALPLTTVPIEPLIGDKALAGPRQEANNNVKLALQFQQRGITKYAAAPSDIASWMHVIPDTSKGTVRIEYDKAKVQQFLSEQVGGKITTLPLDRKVVIDTQSGAQHVLQAGRMGYQLQDVDKLADQVMAALTAGKDLTAEVSVVEAPFKTVTVSGSGKWIEVDLSRQTTVLFVGNAPVASFLISSGRAATPTEVGTFYVYRKLPLTTMTGTILGEYYYVPNIKWVSYFDDGEAFHGTYWHHNFGHPMSHGCINMTEADAKVLYDFAPVGTKVVVHH